MIEIGDIRILGIVLGETQLLVFNLFLLHISPSNHIQKHYMAKSMWTPACRTSHSKNIDINMEMVPPFAAITASTPLGKLSTRSWSITEGLDSIQPQEH